MVEHDPVRLVSVRWGEEYPAPRHPLTIVDAAAGMRKPFPPRELIRSQRDPHVQQGLIDIRHKAYPAYKQRVLSLVRESIGTDRMLVFPEFAFCKDLEESVHQLLVNASGNASSLKGLPIVIGGSYYDETPSGLRIVAPIMVGSTIHHQEKYRPAEGEKEFGRFVAPPSRKIYVFSDTAYGDFAVQICSDVLQERFDEDVVRSLRGRIDFLVVVARNKSSALTERLHDLARTERWVVVYVNGEDAFQDHASAIFRPDSKRSTLRLTSSRKQAKLDIGLLQSALEKQTSLRKTSDALRFQPAPRHWPFKGRRAMTFGRCLKVLAISSHFDDLWLGCLGTLMMLQENYTAEIVCTSLCEIYPHPYFGVYQIRDRTEHIEDTCAAVARRLGFKWHSANHTTLMDRAFEKAALSNAFEELRRAYGDADLVFVPRSDDLNPEHGETARVALGTFQHCDVFEYEVKDFRRVPFRPNVFVDLGGTSNNGWNKEKPTTFAEKKAQVLADLSRGIFGELAQPFRRDRTMGRMSVRAAENAKACDYAEAFVSEFIV